MYSLRLMSSILLLIFTVFVSVAPAAPETAPAYSTSRDGTGDSPPIPFYSWFGHSRDSQIRHKGPFAVERALFVGTLLRLCRASERPNTPASMRRYCRGAIRRRV